MHRLRRPPRRERLKDTHDDAPSSASRSTRGARWRGALSVVGAELRAHCGRDPGWTGTGPFDAHGANWRRLVRTLRTLRSRRYALPVRPPGRHARARPRIAIST